MRSARSNGRMNSLTSGGRDEHVPQGHVLRERVGRIRTVKTASDPSGTSEVTRTHSGVCTSHPTRRALTVVNGVEVCQECLQVVLDVYHEIALRGFDG